MRKIILKATDAIRRLVPEDDLRYLGRSAVARMENDSPGFDIRTQVYRERISTPSGQDIEVACWTTTADELIVLIATAEEMPGAVQPKKGQEPVPGQNVSGEKVVPQQQVPGRKVVPGQTRRGSGINLRR